MEDAAGPLVLWVAGDLFAGFGWFWPDFWRVGQESRTENGGLGDGVASRVVRGLGFKQERDTTATTRGLIRD